MTFREFEISLIISLGSVYELNYLKFKNAPISCCTWHQKKNWLPLGKTLTPKWIIYFQEDV